MAHDAVDAGIERLEAFVGEWSMEAVFPNAPPTDLRGRTTFEWMSGGRFLIQRWEIPHPDAPDGLAIIGQGQDDDTYLQHYFDSRGVARLYEMSFTNGVWKLSRESPDFSPLSFSQRFVGTFKNDNNTIEGRWETARDRSSWEHDFVLTYTRLTSSSQTF
jgi:Protein of unknown function (DUF1579)